MRRLELGSLGIGRAVLRLVVLGGALDLDVQDLIRAEQDEIGGAAARKRQLHRHPP